MRRAACARAIGEGGHGREKSGVLETFYLSSCAGSYFTNGKPVCFVLA